MSSFWLNATIDVLLVIYVLDCLFMGLVILMQRSKQEGLGAAFGGGVTDALWGAQTSQVLVKATVVAAVIFFMLSITLARLYSMRESTAPPTSSVQQELEKSAALTPAPSATNAAPVTTPASTVPSATSTNATAPATAPAVPATQSH